MEYLKKHGSIKWKEIIAIVPEIVGTEPVNIPDKSIRISHRLTYINLKINHRLGELKKNGRISKKSTKFSRGCFNLLVNGKWNPLNNLKVLGDMFPAIEDNRMDAEADA